MIDSENLTNVWKFDLGVRIKIEAKKAKSSWVWLRVMKRMVRTSSVAILTSFSYVLPMLLRSPLSILMMGTKRALTLSSEMRV